MGQKVNPISFRTGIVMGWKSRWYAGKKDFAELLVEDHKIRNFIKKHPSKTSYRQAESIGSRSSELATKSASCCTWLGRV